MSGSWGSFNPHGANRSLIVVLFALDQFIIVVAVPKIVSEFHALDRGEQ